MILMWKFLYFRTSAAEGTYWGRDPRDIQLSAPVPAYTMHINVNMTEISAQIWRKGIGWLCECDFKRSVHCNWCWHCNVANSKHMQQNVLIFFFFCFFGVTAKTVLKKFAKSWMKGMAWFERWETQLFLKFILWATSNMRSDRFCKEKKANFWHFSFLQEISYLLTSLWHDLISPFNFDTATQKLGKDKKKCKKRSKPDFGSIFKPTLKKSPSERICFFMCYMTSYLTLLLVGIPHPSFQPAISFQTFCLEKNLLRPPLMCDIMPDFAGVGQISSFWFCHHFWNWWHIDARVF